MIFTLAATFLNFFGTPCTDGNELENIVQEEMSELNFLISVVPTEKNFLNYNEGRLKAFSFFAAAEGKDFEQNYQNLYTAFLNYQKQKNRVAAKSVVHAVNALIEKPLPTIGIKCVDPLMNLFTEIQKEVASDYSTVSLDTLWHLYGEVDVINLFEKDLQWEFDSTLAEMRSDLGELIQAPNALTWLKLREDVKNLHDWAKLQSSVLFEQQMETEV